jgi:hypothetical protein
MNLNRRAMLGGASALALLPATPASAIVVKPIVIAEPIAPTVSALEPWWGYSYGEELWQGPFESREAAIACARGDGFHGPDDGEVFTALCHPRMLDHPDYVDTILEWLCCARPDRPLRLALRESFEGSNMESDFEGEVEDESEQADWGALADEFTRLLDDAIARSGFFLSGPITSAMFGGDESILSALEKDEVFARALDAAAHRWSDGNELLTCSRMVDLTDEEPLPPSGASA